VIPHLNKIYAGDALEVMHQWPSSFVHCAITSPPYYGLRDYGMAGQIGLEQTPEEYVARLVKVFREVRRVLRDDGTLWINLGDSYVASACGVKSGGVSKSSGLHGGITSEKYRQTLESGHGQTVDKTRFGIPAKNLIGIPWMVAFALRADGWYLRQDIIWSKPNPMPESVTDRCTKSHEYLFLLSKSPRYYFDNEAIKEPAVYRDSKIKSVKTGGFGPNTKLANSSQPSFRSITATRNKRDIWNVAVRPFKDAHFATFPPDLIDPCVLAGTSEGGVCSRCGSPRERKVARTPTVVRLTDRKEKMGDKGRTVTSGTMTAPPTSRTVGWAMTCKCNAPNAPAIILDPFMGAGTSAVAAWRRQRNFIGCELNPKYVKIAEKRLAAEQKAVFGDLV
jgi:DNA modification methylase